MTLFDHVKGGSLLPIIRICRRIRRLFFDAIDTAKQCLKVLTPMFSTMEILKDNMKKRH